MAEFVHDAVDEGSSGGGIGNVESGIIGFSAGLPKCACCLFQRLGVTASQPHMGASLGKGPGDFKTETAAAAGDDGDAVFEREFFENAHRSPSCFRASDRKPCRGSEKPMRLVKATQRLRVCA